MDSPNLEFKAVTYKGLNYTIPESHVEALTEPGQGRIYARLTPPGAPFVLVLSETDDYARNWQGADVPLVTHINDAPGPHFESFDFAEGKTVCRSHVPLRSCGLRIEDGPVAWAVTFNRSEVPNSPSIRAEATRLIRSYRQAERADGR